MLVEQFHLSLQHRRQITRMFDNVVGGGFDQIDPQMRRLDQVGHFRHCHAEFVSGTAGQKTGDGAAVDRLNTAYLLHQDVFVQGGDSELGLVYMADVDGYRHGKNFRHAIRDNNGYTIVQFKLFHMYENKNE